MAAFAEQIAAFSVKAQANVDAVVIGATDMAGVRLIDLTPRPERGSPYATGRMASNWNYAAESPDRHFSAAVDIRTVNGTEDRPAKAAGFNHYITNSAPYAYYVEFGTSKMSPQPMVGLVTLEWSQIVERAALKVAK